MKYVLVLVATMLLSPVFAGASADRTLEGVTLPGKMVRDGQKLTLNGAGVRLLPFFKLYVAGLYVEKVSKKAGKLISSEQIKIMEMTFLREVTGKTLADVLCEYLGKSSRNHPMVLGARIEKFRTLIPNIKKGDKLAFVYVPGAGMSVEVNGEKTGEIVGKDFTDALFGFWLGPIPADNDLKAGLLGA